MKQQLTYYVWPLVLAMAVAGCSENKELNERISLWRKDKIPYGTYYSYEALAHLFPNASTITERKLPTKTNNLYWPVEDESRHKAAPNAKTAMIVISPRVEVDESDLASIINFAQSGNIVFLSAIDFSTNLLDSFKLKIAPMAYLHDSLRVSILDPGSAAERFFVYPGKGLNNYFTVLDTTYCAILGWSRLGKANFVRVRYQNGGTIFFHLEPFAFTNFFLLHKNNKEYYDEAFSYLPPDIRTIVWNDYYRSNHRSNGSSLDVIMKYPSLRWALWLILLLFAIIYLFESKRRQRLIPVIMPLANTSLDFVRTIGRLYFQRRDNKNLAGKMVAHFMGHVRSRYNISTSSLDEEFEKRLAYKSGYDPVKLKMILAQANALSLQSSVSDQELLAFHEQVENFYKQA